MESSSAVPLWWTLLLLTAASSSQTIAIYPRTAVVFLDTARTLPPEDVRSIQVAGDAALQKDTSLELVLPTFVDLETSAFLDCPSERRFGCWSEVAARSNEPVSYVLVLAAGATAGKRARLGGLWLDVKRARAAPASLDGPSRENWIFEHAVVALPSAEVQVEPSALASYFGELFGRRLRPSFEAAGVWQPYGTIEIVGPGPDYSIELDDRRVGTTSEVSTHLEGVVRGPHRLQVRRGDDIAYAGAVDAGEVTRVDIAVPPSESRANTNTAVSIAGFATSAVGAALIVYAVSSTPVPAAGACAGPGCPPMSGGGWVTSCQLGAYDDACIRDPSGVLVPGVGLAMILGGATIGLGGLLFESDEAVPWWSIVAGVAAGLLAYGASVLLFYPEGVP